MAVRRITTCPNSAGVVDSWVAVVDTRGATRRHTTRTRMVEGTVPIPEVATAAAMVVEVRAAAVRAARPVAVAEGAEGETESGWLSSAGSSPADSGRQSLYVSVCTALKNTSSAMEDMLNVK